MCSISATTNSSFLKQHVTSAILLDFYGYVTFRVIHTAQRIWILAALIATTLYLL